MLKYFVFISRSKRTHIASFIFSDSCFSAAQIPKISHQALTVASLDNNHVLHAHCNCQPFVFIVVWCIARPANRNVKAHFHNCIKIFLQFHTHNIVQFCGSIVRGQSEAVRMTMHSYQTYTFCFQLLRQKIESTYDIAAVCCNSHVQENMLSSSNRFTSIQGKTISRYSGFRVSFWHSKTD